MSRGATQAIGWSGGRMTGTEPAFSESGSSSRFEKKKPQRRCRTDEPDSSSRVSVSANPSISPAPWRFSAPTLDWNTVRPILFSLTACATAAPNRA